MNIHLAAPGFWWSIVAYLSGLFLEPLEPVGPILPFILEFVGPILPFILLFLTLLRILFFLI